MAVSPWSALSGPVVPIAAAQGVPGLIRTRYAQTRDSIVCADETRSLTGYELEMLSDALAAQIRRALPETGPETAPESGPVLVRLRRGVERAIAVLGILKAGRAYLPVDLDEPAPRVAAMTRLAQPVAAIGETAGLDARLPVFDVPRRWEAGADPAPLPDVPPQQPVYVMFTSGSTGQPKGVVLGSAALCTRLLWTQRRYPLTAADRVLQKTPYTFDPSAWELFWPLIAGARCEFAPDGAHRDPGELAAFMIDRQITVCHFVPSMLAEFVRVPRAGDISLLRHVICSGEALPAPLARRALDLWPAQLHNLYGPTEAAIDVTYWDVPFDLSPTDVVPIGMPVDNTVLWVMADDGRPVPPGEAGELWIGGDQLALGYAGRPDLTSAAFPVVGGQRSYRTGDLVRQGPGGLAYLGRIDEQVKIGGVRVEPLEAERVLAELHSALAVVAVSAPDGPVLIAALAADPTASEVSDEDLRRYAVARLPAALVPVACCRLTAFPLSSNGKLDRRQLATLVHSWWEQQGTDDNADPLRSIWARALQIHGPVPEETGFLSAGGASLTAIRLMSTIWEATGIEVPVGRFLDENISLAGLRAAMAQERATIGWEPEREQERGSAAGQAPPAAPDGGLDVSPLAPEQRRLWLISQRHPDSSAYNVAALVRFTGELNVPALHSALNATVLRHDILRARVDEDASGGPCLRYAASVTAELAQEDTGEPLDAAVIDDFARRAMTTVISDRQAPMLRARLLRSAAAGQACLALVFNHLIADQDTVEIVLADMAAAYAAALAGEPAPLAPAPRYASYAAAATARAGDEAWTSDVAYWRDRLAGAPPALLLPSRLADGTVQGFAGAAESLRLPPEFRQRLDAYLREQGATMAGFFLAVFAAVLSGWSGQSTVVIGLPSSRRRSASQRQLAGFLVDTLPIRVDLAGVGAFSDLLRHVRTRYAEAMEHSRPAFDAVVSELRLPPSPGRNPVFQVWLNDLTAAAPLPRFPGLACDPVLPPTPAALFDLGLYLHRDGEGLVIQLVRAVGAYPAEATRELLGQCALLADRVLAGQPVPLDGSGLVTAAAAAILPRPDGPLPAPGQRAGMLGAVADAVRRSPESVAVVFPRGQLRYQELWERATRAAAGLTASGVGAEDLVAVRATRHGDLPVAVLACWLAGAGAALIDASLPPARRDACGAALGAKVIMTTAPVGGGLPTVSDLAGLAGPGLAPAQPAPGTAGGLSHVLFTSGTTGTPVPVCVPHGPLHDFLRWYIDTFDLGPADRFALLAGTGHDPVLREMFGALLAGAQLHVPAPEVAADAGHLLSWLASSRITVVHATPALLELLVKVGQETGSRLDAVRLIVSGGAPLSWGLARRLRGLTGAEIVNAYGTTETPQIASCYRLPDDDDPRQPDSAPVPVGAGVAGQQLLVLTPSGQLAGVGQRGEIVVRGGSLALGYLDGHGWPDRFGADPRPGVRTFRTGDRGRYGPDGLVRLDGRVDRQVSIGGHRVELTEIEATALRHPLVRQALATLAEDAVGPVLTLQVWAPGLTEGGELRAFLRGLLPAHAVPVSVRVVEELALGVTGKVRPTGPETAGRPPGTALADPVPPAAQAAAPSPVQRALQMIEFTVRDWLGRPLGLDENFFDAGLTSLNLVGLHELSSRELASPFPVTAMFAYPNLRALRRHLTQGDLATAPVAGLRPAGGDQRRIGNARRELRRQIRGEDHS